MKSYLHDVIERLDKAMPGQDPALLAFYAQLAVTTGEKTNRDHVHQAWGLWRVTGGWTFGPVKDNDAKVTPYLVPFPELSEEIAAYDDEYVAAIRAVARDLREEGVAH